MMKNTYKGYEDGFVHNGWSNLLSYCTRSSAYIGIKKYDVAFNIF